MWWKSVRGKMSAEIGGKKCMRHTLEEERANLAYALSGIGGADGSTG